MLQWANPREALFSLVKPDGFEGGRVKDCSITIGQPTGQGREGRGEKISGEDRGEERERSKEKNKKMTVRLPQD